MNTLIKILKSRTTWTLVLMFVIGGVDAIATVIPEGVKTPLMGALSLLAVYFKINPSQKY